MTDVSETVVVERRGWRRFTIDPRPLRHVAYRRLFIGNAASKFDAQGRLTDETTRKFLSELLAGFQQWIVRMQKK